MRQHALNIAWQTTLRTRAPSLPSHPASSTVSLGHDTWLPPPGTLLKQHFRGEPVLVRVLVSSFEYDGRVFGSLSTVANKVAGGNWNDFVFFGLKQEKQRANRPGRHPGLPCPASQNATCRFERGEPSLCRPRRAAARRTSSHAYIEHRPERQHHGDRSRRGSSSRQRGSVSFGERLERHGPELTADPAGKRLERDCRNSTRQQVCQPQNGHGSDLEGNPEPRARRKERADEAGESRAAEAGETDVPHF